VSFAIPHPFRYSTEQFAPSQKRRKYALIAPPQLIAGSLAASHRDAFSASKRRPRSLLRMKIHKVGIIMNGVTGRMGTNQHLYRSIASIIKHGGLKVSDDEVIMPDPILVGRSAGKLKKVADGANLPEGTLKISTDLDAVLADKNYSVY